MDKLRVKLKKALNKDVTNLLNKYKILLVSIAIVVILACVGLIVSYAFYQVIDTTPVLLSTTPKIPDLDIRIMAEDRDTNGNGVNSYSVYPYIPKAGYKYEASMSYCTNGAKITYNSDSFDASIDATGHDVCYLYFKSTASLDITLEVYAENVNSDGVGNGVYTKLETTELPSVGYEFNSSMSYCVYANDLNTHVTDTTVTYNTDKQNFTVNAKKKGAICKAYMDAMDVDIALKIFVQSKKGSTTYFEVDKIPTNNFYELGSKSACTGTSTMSIQNQKVVIAATNRTNCVAYLNVGSGPILESMQNIVSGQNVTINLTNSNVGLTPAKYYYSKDNGDTYVESTATNHTFENLAPATEFTFKAYSVDSSGNGSGILATTSVTDYVYNGLFDYSSAVQSKLIEVSGYYKLEVWGAEGGYAYSSPTTYPGGKGGYSVGTVYLNKGDTVFIHTGGQGAAGTTTASVKTGGVNGGGNSGYKMAGSGGGGTDIRINNDDILARVIVAGGGGGGANYSGRAGGYGGGLNGGNGTAYAEESTAKGGTQTSGGSKGIYGSYNGNDGTFFQGGAAGNARSTSNNYSNSGGGGGGWYGGGAGGYATTSGTNQYAASGGGGGSGFVYTNSATLPSGYLLNVDYQLTSAQTIAGNSSFKSPLGVDETGHSGNGYAKITYIGQTLE